jgi:hypothetical protein
MWLNMTQLKLHYSLIYVRLGADFKEKHFLGELMWRSEGNEKINEIQKIPGSLTSPGKFSLQRIIVRLKSASGPKSFALKFNLLNVCLHLIHRLLERTGGSKPARIYYEWTRHCYSPAQRGGKIVFLTVSNGIRC